MKPQSNNVADSSLHGPNCFTCAHSPLRKGAGRQSMRTAILAAAALIAFVVPATAAAVRHITPTPSSVLAGNDDGSVAVNFGFNINFDGVTYNSGFLNNNGNITFNNSLSTYIPFPIVANGLPMLAPLFGDIDTRSQGAVTYGQGTFGGNNAFEAYWSDVGLFSGRASRITFNMLIIDRSDIAAGDFDLEYNYDNVPRDDSQTSKNFRMGFTNGIGNSFELVGSGVVGGLIDSNATTGLINNSINSNVDGRYIFQFRAGQAVPEPSSVALLSVGLIALGMARRRC